MITAGLLTDAAIHRIRAALNGCVCSCPRNAHRHLRAGTDCGICGCAQFRRAYPWRPRRVPPTRAAKTVTPHQPGTWTPGRGLRGR